MTTGIILLLLAFFLLVAEIFVSSFGVLGLAGIVSLLIGADMVIESAGPDAPINWGMVLGLLFVFLSYVVVSSVIVFRSLSGRRAAAGIESLLGEEAEVVEWADRSGLVTVQGELWEAASERHHPDFVPGSLVRVSGYPNLTLKVRENNGD